MICLHHHTLHYAIIIKGWFGATSVSSSARCRVGRSILKNYQNDTIRDALHETISKQSRRMSNMHDLLLNRIIFHNTINVTGKLVLWNVIVLFNNREEILDFCKIHLMNLKWTCNVLIEPTDKHGYHKFDSEMKQ